jgi:uncharacterized protein DUF885
MSGVHISIPELPRLAPLRNVKNYDDFLTRTRAEKALGTKFDIRKFHNALIDDGPLPLDVLEQRIEEWIKAQS